MFLRKNEFRNVTVETIYFGGGTPSLLSANELQVLIDAVLENYNVSSTPEITLEANPDDLSKETLLQLSSSPINRLSIGIQSFFEEDLKLMNRAHNASEARACLDSATVHFDNISIDLIYGIPGLTHQRWQNNIDIALSYNLPHISSYALTVEPKTALERFIKKGIIENVDDDLAQEQFHMLIASLESQNFVHYELSNFGKLGFFSRNNSAYWLGKSYLGVGPSAHSFNGNERSWNISNNTKYINAITNNSLPSESETLSTTDKYNEYIMTGLRTIWGVSLKKITLNFGAIYRDHLLQQAEPFINQQLLYIEHEKLKVTNKGKFLCDGIASTLFKIN